MEEEEYNDNIIISYLNNKIDNFTLPKSLYKFRTKIKTIFQIPNELDKIFINYIVIEKDEEKKEVIHEIKKNEDYTSLLDDISSDDIEIKDNTLFIETERVPEEISRETPQNFEDEIECVIRTHLNTAGERIKKELSGRKEFYHSSKIQDKLCSRCRQKIIGNIYRGVPEVKQQIYCEKCSYIPGVPMFVIH